MPGKIGRKIRNKNYAKKFKNCPCDLRVETGVLFSELQNSSCGNNVLFMEGSRLYGNGNGTIKIGNNCNFATHSVINAGEKGLIEIGNNVLIAPYVYIRSSNHRFDDCTTPIRYQGHIPGIIRIEDDVWIGAKAVILPNVSIGRGSVIGAGAVVTKDIPPFSVAVGVPARVVWMREKSKDTDDIHTDPYDTESTNAKLSV